MAKTNFRFIRGYKLGEARRRKRQVKYLTWARHTWSVACLTDGEELLGRECLHLWYNRAFKRGWLTITFPFFEAIVTGLASVNDVYPAAPRRVSWWRRMGKFWRKQRHFERPGSAYRRNPAHVKKQVSDDDIAKREWRRQQSKHTGKGGWRHRGPRRYYKQRTARDHRAWVKQQLHHERYDALGGNCGHWEYRQFIDSYLWD